MDSILYSVKKFLGGEMVSDVFDSDIIMHINTAISVLKQIGVNATKCSIDGPETNWTEIFPDIKTQEMIKSYICIDVKLHFDPPANSTLIDNYLSQLSELSWRINAEADPHWREEDKDGRST